MHKASEFQQKYIKQMLENIIKWQLELSQNIQEQYLGIRPATCIINLMHDLALYIRNIDIDPDEWEDMYVEASDKARKEFFDTVNKGGK